MKKETDKGWRTEAEAKVKIKHKQIDFKLVGILGLNGTHEAKDKSVKG